MPSALQVDQARPVAADGPAPSMLRTDIQALRAIAVCSVLVYHVWPTRLTGGYVGVDIFFVISGFLIVSHVLKEAARTGTVRLGTFWARRARRLLPASLLTLLVTAVAVAVWAPRSLWEGFYREIVSAALYFENWRLAADSVDYLRAENLPSPVQHYWTLSAEEQFYVLVPVLVLLCALVARRRRVPVRPVAFVALCAGLVASFVYSMLTTASSEGLGYFSTFSRAWEFLAGALLAYVVVGARWRRLAPWLVGLGLALVAVTVVSFDAATTFPAPWAAVPVIGVALAIPFGPGTFLERLGAWSPVAFVARCSFAIYLWHFPIITVLPFALGRPLGFWDKLGAVTLTFVLAYLSTTFVEDPVRFSTRLLGGRRPRTVGIVSLLMMLVVVLSAVGLSHDESSRSDAARTNAAQILAGPHECLGAAALDPAHAPCDNPELDGVLIPDPAARGADDANRPACWSTSDDGTASVCRLGPGSGYVKHLVALGDSHNNALISAYEAIARTNNWRIDVTGRGGCYWTTAVQTQASPSVADREGCVAWRQSALDWINDQADLDGIITTHARANRTPVPVPHEPLPETIARGQAEAWAMREDLTVPVLAITDNPTMPPDVGPCVERYGLDAAALCGVPRDKAFPETDGMRRAVKMDPNARLINMTRWYCDRRTCPPVIGNTVVYRDDHHLSGTYALTLAPYLGAEISKALGRSSEAG